jgi:hypothetical protein
MTKGRNDFYKERKKQNRKSKKEIKEENARRPWRALRNSFYFV